MSRIFLELTGLRSDQGSLLIVTFDTDNTGEQARTDFVDLYFVGADESSQFAGAHALWTTVLQV